MLTQTEMFVVFVLDQFISQGYLKVNGRITPKSNMIWKNPWKCRSDGANLETYWVERGKPHEWATQTKVGASFIREFNQTRGKYWLADRWLHLLVQG